MAHRSDETDAWPRENDAKSLYWLLLCPTPPSFNRDLIISNSAGTNISAMEHLQSTGGEILLNSMDQTSQFLPVYAYICAFILHFYANILYALKN